ncbi:ROK family protein [Kribbella turkmenica]|uniref:ROK family protein n=1 Tax=Kribbella turkmenica TaxID=2530375 RepID=A0A4R4XDZ5_9ACTN|nr:ROK family protein [Kribbella turkmenica]TDD29018.1 ROK family protein [Kribbella turkmenica]
MDVAVLEIGGSHVTAAVVSSGSWAVDVVERADLESRKAAEVVLDQLAAAARKLPLANGLAVALPGPFDFATGVAWYRGQGKFDHLYGYKVGERLRGLLDLDQILFMNDAEAFAVGEWTAGAVREVDRCVGVTIGTGIGTAFLADGRVVRAGETVPPGGELYKTSYDGKPLEDWISARAILRAYFARTGTEEPEIGVKEIADRAREGTGDAREVLVEAFGVLAAALPPWLERFGVTKVVLGGSISGAFDIVREVFDFDVAATEDTEHSALIGAAAHYVRSR